MLLFLVTPRPHHSGCSNLHGVKIKKEKKLKQKSSNKNKKNQSTFLNFFLLCTANFRVTGALVIFCERIKVILGKSSSPSAYLPKMYGKKILDTCRGGLAMFPVIKDFRK